MTAAPVDPEWEPGVPLYDRAAHPHSCYLFNFRPDSESDTCGCPDAADWPGQKRRPLPPGDEIGDLIDLVRADRGPASDERSGP